MMQPQDPQPVVVVDITVPFVKVFQLVFQVGCAALMVGAMAAVILAALYMVLTPVLGVLR